MLKFTDTGVELGVGDGGTCDICGHVKRVVLVYEVQVIPLIKICGPCGDLIANLARRELPGETN